MPCGELSRMAEKTPCCCLNFNSHFFNVLRNDEMKNCLHLLKLFITKPFVVLLLLAGCGAIHKPFVPMDAGVVVKPTTIAVISGDSGEPSQHLADFLSQELSKQTTFKVVDQEEISRRVEKYPLNLDILDAFEQDKPVWVSPTNKVHLDNLQRRLRTEYLFVIWGHNLCSGPGFFTNVYSITSLGNLYRYPGGRPLAFVYDQNERSMSLKGAFKGEAYDIDELLRDSAARIVRDMVQVINAGK